MTKDPSKEGPSTMKWERNGELAQKDLADLIDRLRNVENEGNSSELSRLSTKTNNLE